MASLRRSSALERMAGKARVAGLEHEALLRLEVLLGVAGEEREELLHLPGWLARADGRVEPGCLLEESPVLGVDWHVDGEGGFQVNI